MQELTPKEYADLLNEDGELLSDKMSDEQKLTLLLAKTLKSSDGASAGGRRCSLCNGTGFQSGSMFTCPWCHGKGYQ